MTILESRRAAAQYGQTSLPCQSSHRVRALEEEHTCCETGLWIIPLISPQSAVPFTVSKDRCPHSGI